MPAYILIDNNSGYIFGDMRDIGGKSYTGADITPEAAARTLDEHLNAGAAEYETYSPNYRQHGDDAYHVYRVDVAGSEVIPIIWDGQDQETIERVERDCVKVAIVTRRALD
jgi:hypothetical protein